MGVRECKYGLCFVFFCVRAFPFVGYKKCGTRHGAALIAKLLIQRCCDGFLFQYLKSSTRKSQRHRLVIHSSEAAVSIFLHRCLWLHFFFFCTSAKKMTLTAWLLSVFFFNGGKKKKLRYPLSESSKSLTGQRGTPPLGGGQRGRWEVHAGSFST